MKKGKYFLLFLCLLAILQLVDYLFYSSNIAQINNKFVFGYIGNNILAAVIAVIFLILIYLFIPKSKNIIISYVFLASAVLSNVFERIFYTGVVDYLKIWFIPTFNLADIIIVISLIFISFQIFKKNI